MYRGDYQGGGGRGGGRGGGNRGGWMAPVPGQHELRMPQGWEDCPAFGEPIKLPNNQMFQVIPSKVPLMRAYTSMLRNPNNLYTLRDAVFAMQDKFKMKVGMIMDLTNSSRYYNFYEEFPDAEYREITYVKVPCRGRGESPSPQAVNHAVFELYRFWQYFPDAYVMMHCTHGFNRTGYVLACAMVRLAADKGMSVDRSVRRFAEARPPGIYKDAYINDLFRYHHEVRKPHIVTPHTPQWKGDKDDEDDGDMEVPAPAAPTDVRHECIEEIGEPVVPEEAIYLRDMVYQILTGRTPEPHRPPHFPGSQPVSLACSNLNLLEQQRYWVSWKADGTRYLLLILDRGCYLIDRAFKVVRVQMRFPTPGKVATVKESEDGPTIIRGEYPVGKPHNITLLDGEMVVDEDHGTKYRRYLVYDMAVMNSNVMVTEPWIKRFMAVEEHVINPRVKERSFILGQIDARRERYRGAPLGYEYSAEPFSVRKKDFWPLWRAHKVIHEMIPALSHEADGLILQSCDSGYVANTDNALLKFKFAHLNSVDFKLEVEGSPSNPVYRLYVIDSSRRRVRGARGPPLMPIDGTVEFPESVEGPSLHGAIIECTWSEANHRWRYLRTRVDKDTPNAAHVYEKVKISISDNIKEDELLRYLDQVFWNIQAYEKDRAVVPPDKVPHPLPAHPADQPFQGARRGLPPPPPGAPVGYPEGDDDDEMWGQPGEVPWSPPYYGPEPTPPRDTSQPLDPAVWIPHDPSTYPPHLLPALPPPPPLEEHPDHQGGGGGVQGFPVQGDGVQGSGHVPEGDLHDPDVNPYYVDEHEAANGGGAGRQGKRRAGGEAGEGGPPSKRGTVGRDEDEEPADRQVLDYGDL